MQLNKFNCIATLLNMIVLPDLYMADTFLGHLLSYEDIWGGLPKVWLSYVEAFLYHTVAQREGYLEDGVLNAYSQSHVLSCAFVLKAKLSKHLQEKYLTTPSGRFNLSVRHENPPKLCHFKYFTEGGFLDSRAWLWVITMNPDVSLITTVEQLHIPQRIEETCSEASLNLHTEASTIGHSGSTPSVPQLHWECAALVIDIQKTPIMKFCGWRSDFNVYFSQKYRDMKVAICYQEFSSILVNMVYQLTDVNGVKNIPYDHHQKRTNFTLVSIISSEEKQLYSTHLVAPKIAQFVLVVNQELNAFVVFDGPSQHSLLLNTQNNLIKTTTFQCLVQYLLVLKRTEFNSSFHFHHFTSDQYNKQLAVNQSANFPVFKNLPAKGCSSRFCFVGINVGGDQKINVTILQIAFHGQNSFSCKFAGITSFQYRGSNFLEDKTVCSFPGELFTVKSYSLYSRSSKCLLLVYWYPEVNSQQVNIIISKTMCHLVHIDPCAVKLLCNDWSPTSNCITHLTATSNHSNFMLETTLEATDHESWVLENANLLPTVKYTANHFGCSIIQFTQSKLLFPEMWDSRCGLNLIGNHQTFAPFQVYVKAYIASTTPACFKFLAEENTSSSNAFHKESNNFAQNFIDDRSKLFMLIKNILTSRQGNFLDQVEITFWGSSSSWLDIVLNVSEMPVPRKTNCQFVFLQQVEKILDHRLQNVHHMFSLCSGQIISQKDILDISFQLLLDNKKFPGYIVADTLKSLALKTAGHMILPDQHILFCTVRQMFSLSDECFPYSFPGRFSSLDVMSRRDMTLSIWWNYYHYDKYLRQINTLQKCDKVVSLHQSGSFCLNFFVNSSFSDAFGNYIVVGTEDNITIIPINQSHIPWNNGLLLQDPHFSWDGASTVCSEIGGFLPIFYQRQDMHQLLAFIKISQECPYMPAIFIGLSRPDSQLVKHLYLECNVAHTGL